MKLDNISGIPHFKVAYSFEGEKMGQKRFTASELKEFDGSQGRPTYVSLKGKVYDVSSSPYWKAGKHLGAHGAGLDLTMHIANAPHNEDTLKGFKVVGELIQEGYARQKLIRRVQNLHLHPMLVHFSLAYSITVPLLASLYTWTRQASFETASFYVLLLGLLAAPVAASSGIFSWKVTYEGRTNKVFSRKILLTILLMLVTAVSLAWRIFYPNVLVEGSSLSYAYLALNMGLLPISLLLGHYGGKIVYP